jgi:hypothetical protein
MAPSNPPTSGLNHAIEQAGVVLGAEAGPVASRHSSQAFKSQKALAVIRSRLGTRWIVGGVLGTLGTPILLALLKLPNGFLWGPIEVPDVSPGVLLVLGSFAGSLVAELAVRAARIIAAMPLHYWNLFEVWSKFRMGRIPPEQYYAHGAALDYQRIYRGVPPNARPETQDQFVRRVIQWRMKSSQGTKGIPSGSGPPPR